MEFLLIFGEPFLLVLAIAAQCSIARRAVPTRGVTSDRPFDAWSGLLATSTMAAPLLAIAAIWMRHVAQTALDSALHINRATTTIAVAGLNLPVFAAIRMGEMACVAMLIVAGLGASVYFDSEFVTRRLRAIEIVAWSLAGLTLAGSLAFLVMLSRMPNW